MGGQRGRERLSKETVKLRVKGKVWPHRPALIPLDFTSTLWGFDRQSAMGRLINFLRRVDAGAAAGLSWLKPVSQPATARILALAAGAVWLSYMIVLKVHLVGTGTLTSDIAYYGNMLYNTGWRFANGSFYFLYSMYGVLAHGSTTFLTEHFSPTFGLLAPAYRLLPFPELLAVLQPVFILTAGAGLYRLTQRLVAAHGLSPGYGLLPALVLTAYLFNYSNVAATVDVLYGFHHDSMIPPLLVWTVVCVVEARWRAVLVLFILFLGMKENLPIITFAGLAFCFAFNWVVPRKKAAIGLLLCGLFFAGCYWMEFRTHNRHVGILNHFFDSDLVYQAMDRTTKWTIVRNFWPALFAPPFALPALADFCLQLMGDTNELDWHSYPLMTFGMLGVVWALVTLLHLTRRWSFPGLAGYVALVGLMLGPMIVAGAASGVAIWRGAFRLPTLVDRSALTEISALVPKEAKLSTSSDLLVFFTDRPKLLWPESASLSQYVLVNRRAKAENQRQADEFMKTAPVGDKAAAAFYGYNEIVLRGFAYDDVLYEAMDTQVAAGRAEVVGRRGIVTLYKLR